MLTLGRAIERYDAEIAHCDSSVEQAAGTLKELGILDRTLIIVVSDHGTSAPWNYRLASVRTIV